MPYARIYLFIYLKRDIESLWYNKRKSYKIIIDYRTLNYEK